MHASLKMADELCSSKDVSLINNFARIIFFLDEITYILCNSNSVTPYNIEYVLL